MKRVLLAEKAGKHRRLKPSPSADAPKAEGLLRHLFGRNEEELEM